VRGIRACLADYEFRYIKKTKTNYKSLQILGIGVVDKQVPGESLK
jgi:hypothetical protein